VTTLPAEPQPRTFQTAQALTIVSGHFFHDTYTAFVAPLLPLIIEKLKISLTQAGALTAFMTVPAVLNPFIGHLADRISVRYFVIFAPAATATLIGLLGFAPTYAALTVLFLLVGISTAAFHAPAPAIVARVSGNRVGLGMSLFMAGGELGRTLGPIVAVSAVAAWGLEGVSRLIVIGWGSSLVLLWRFRQIHARPEARRIGSLRADAPRLLRLFVPILLVVFLRAFLETNLNTYLPTLLEAEGASLTFAGVSLSIFQGAGVVGALASGTASDRLGRNRTLLVASAASVVLMFVFLETTGWLTIPVLVLLGFATLAPQPVLLALVQDHVPDNRALANGVHLMLTFLVRSLVLILIGMAGDAWGLRTAFYASGVIALLALPAILALPKTEPAGG
jgi:FSR family fosmidomycin resistance protein-like MFS transporter